MRSGRESARWIKRGGAIKGEESEAENLQRKERETPDQMERHAWKFLFSATLIFSFFSTLLDRLKEASLIIGIITMGYSIQLLVVNYFQIIRQNNFPEECMPFISFPSIIQLKFRKRYVG